MSTNKQHTLSVLQVDATGLEIIKKREDQKRQEEHMNASKNCIVDLGKLCVHCYLGCLIVGYCMVIVLVYHRQRIHEPRVALFEVLPGARKTRQGVL